MAYMFDHNPNINPFWDFLSSLEEHPFFAGRFPPGPPPPGGQEQTRPQHAAQGGTSGAEASSSAAPAEKPSSDEQPKEQNEKAAEEPSAPRTRGLGENTTEKDTEGRHHGCHGRRGGRGDSRGRGGMHGGCPAFEGGPEGFPFAWGARGRWGGGPGPHGHHNHHHHGFGFGGGRGGRGRRGGGFRGRGGPRGHWDGEGFDLSTFLQRIGSRIGIDLSDVARELSVQSNDQIDFVPRADLFDLPSEYIVHASLPGAQKPDISVDYDAEDNVLRLAGVVYRPQISEELHDALVVNERTREVGVFERNVRLGTAEQPAHVEVDAITAKLEDGILVVRIPKVHVDPEKLRKKVSIETVDTAKGKAKETENEKQVLVDVDDDNEKHASVIDVPDESDAMHVDSETEHGDEPPHYQSGQYTPPPDSGDEFEEDTKEYVKVNVD